MENIFFDIKLIKNMGEGAIVGKTARLRKPEQVTIGRKSIIDDFTYIPCSLDLGDFSHIGSGCKFIGGAGKVTIGRFVNIAPGCAIVTGSNDYKGGGLVGPGIPKEFSGEARVAPVVIGDHALLGVFTTVLEGVEIPEGMATGAYTLVRPGVTYKPWTLYAGIPAREICPRDGSEMKKQSEQLLASLEENS